MIATSKQEYADAVREFISRRAFGQPLSAISKDLRQLCENFTKRVVDNSNEKTIIGVKGDSPMTDDAKRAAKAVDDLYAAKIEQLTAEYKRRLQELTELRKANARELGADETMLNIDLPSHVELYGKSHAEAAEWALRKFGKAASLAEIVESLMESGYEPGMEEKVLTNSLFVAMNRKPALFKKHIKRWVLTEWSSGKKK